MNIQKMLELIQEFDESFEHIILHQAQFVYQQTQIGRIEKQDCFLMLQELLGAVVLQQMFKGD